MTGAVSARREHRGRALPVALQSRSAKDWGIDDLGIGEEKRDG